MAMIANAEIYEMIMGLPVEKSQRVIDYVRLLYEEEENFEPNQETIDAMNEALHGDLQSVNSVEELMVALNADD